MMRLRLHGEQLQPRDQRQSDTGRAGRRNGEQSNTRSNGSAGAEVAATVAAMQQQLDAQLALSRTLTESLTGMLQQAVTLRRMLEIALHNNRVNSAGDSDPTRLTSFSAACDGGAGGSAQQQRVNRERSDGGETNSLTHSGQPNGGPAKRRRTTYLHNDGASVQPPLPSSAAAATAAGPAAAFAQEPGKATPRPPFSISLGATNPEERHLLRYHTLPPLPQQAPPPLPSPPQLLAAHPMALVPSPLGPNPQNASGPHSWRLSDAAAAPAAASGNGTAGSSASASGVGGRSGSVGAATPQSLRRFPAGSGLGSPTGAMQAPVGADLPVLQVGTSTLLGAATSNGSKHGSNDAQDSGSLAAAAALAAASAAAAAENAVLTAQLSGGGVAPAAAAADAELGTQHGLSWSPTQARQQQATMLLHQELQLPRAWPHTQMMVQQQLLDIVDRTAAPPFQPCSAGRRSEQRQQSQEQDYHHHHHQQQQRQQFDDGPPPFLRVQQQQEQLQQELLRCQLRQQQWQQLQQQQQQQQGLQILMLQQQQQQQRQEQHRKQHQQLYMQQGRRSQQPGQQQLKQGQCEDLQQQQQQQQRPLPKERKNRLTRPSSSAGCAAAPLSPCVQGVASTATHIPLLLPPSAIATISRSPGPLQLLPGFAAVSCEDPRAPAQLLPMGRTPGSRVADPQDPDGGGGRPVLEDGRASGQCRSSPVLQRQSPVLMQQQQPTTTTETET